MTINSDTFSIKAQAALGRQCGSCAMCCKLVAVSELEKKEGIWCSHCLPGEKACQIYDSRPQSCAGFFCGWLQSDLFGPEWYPKRSKMVIVPENDGHRLTIYVDPDFSNNWRKNPYHEQIKQLTYSAAQTRTQLLVRIINRVIVLLPNKEVDLGEIQYDDHIHVRKTISGEWVAELIPAGRVPEQYRGKWVSK